MLGNKTTPRGSGLRAALVAAGITLLATSGAHAAGTLITVWDYTLQDGFTSWAGDNAGPGDIHTSLSNPYLETNFSPDCGAGGCGVGNAPTKLQWPGTLPQNPPPASTPLASDSFIQVAGNNNPPNPGEFLGTGLITNGAFQDTVTISHRNFEQADGSEALDTATLTSVLILDPAVPNLPSFSPFFITLEINFKETPNDGSLTGDDDDIFVLDIAGAGFDANTNELVQPLNNILGADYEVRVGLVDALNMPALDFLTETECAAAGVPGFVIGGDDGNDTNNCIGLTTEEDQLSTFQARLSISGELQPMDMPEPGALGLLGVGLVGLGLARRRQKKVA